MPPTPIRAKSEMPTVGATAARCAFSNWPSNPPRMTHLLVRSAATAAANAARRADALGLLHLVRAIAFDRGRAEVAGAALTGGARILGIGVDHLQRVIMPHRAAEGRVVGGASRRSDGECQQNE